MNEARAREVVLLQAFETAHPPSPSWRDDDRAWATRLALQDGAPSAEAFFVRRAHHAWQRLAAREPAAAKWLATSPWRWRWSAWAALAGFGVGLLADSIGSSQRINLLAPPLWGVLVWNVVVYAVLLGHLLGHVLARAMQRKTRPGTLVRGLVRWMQRWPSRWATGRPAGWPMAWAARLGGRGRREVGERLGGSSAQALRGFTVAWMTLGGALAAARAATLLHVAAAALALGLVAGLYLRGLVLDYRAAWESTFLSADAARGVLRLALAPAVAVTGIAWPDAAAFEALRGTRDGAPAGAGASGLADRGGGGLAASGATTGSTTDVSSLAPSTSAAPWIHLLAATLLLFVTGPRLLLAGLEAARAWWLARHLALPSADPYFERLARERSGGTARVVVWPHAATPSPQATLGLRAVFAAALGKGVALRIAPTTPFDAEDAIAAEPGTTLAAALFDLVATPEAESQGRFVQRLAAAGAPVVVLVDEAAFKRRFGAASPRLAERCAAWRQLAETHGTTAVLVDLDTAAAPAAPGASDESAESAESNVPAASRALQAAMRRPVGTS